MRPEQKAKYLIDKFGFLAEDVAEECKRSSYSQPYWDDVLKALYNERVIQLSFNPRTGD